MYLDFSGVFSRWDLFAQAALVTVYLTLAAIVAGLCIGVTAAAGTRSRFAIVRFLPFAYVDIIRNTPFLVQAFIVYFGLPSIGIQLSPIPAAIIALSIYAGGYLAEIARAGIESVNHGQIEAARSLGLSPFLTFRLVIVKQALAAVYPSLTSQFILILFSSSIVSAISVQELTATANDAQGATFRTMEAFLFVAVIYHILAAGFRAVFAAIDRYAFAFTRLSR